MKAEELAISEKDCWRNIAIALIDPIEEALSANAWLPTARGPGNRPASSEGFFCAWLIRRRIGYDNG